MLMKYTTKEIRQIGPTLQNTAKPGFEREY